MFRTALSVCLSLNIVVLALYFLIQEFQASEFAQIEDWFLFIRIMLSLGATPHV